MRPENWKSRFPVALLIWPKVVVAEADHPVPMPPKFTLLMQRDPWPCWACFPSANRVHSRVVICEF
jgi:hypothetical protein